MRRLFSFGFCSVFVLHVLAPNAGASVTTRRMAPSATFCVEEQALAAAVLNVRHSYVALQTAATWRHVPLLGGVAMGAAVTVGVVLGLGTHPSVHQVLSAALTVLSGAVVAALGYLGVHHENYELNWFFKDPYMVVSILRLHSEGPLSPLREKEMATFRFNLYDVQQGKPDALLEELAAPAPGKAKEWIARQSPDSLRFLANTIDVFALQAGYYFTHQIPEAQRRVLPVYREESVSRVVLLLTAGGARLVDPFGRSFSADSGDRVKWLSLPDSGIDSASLEDFFMRLLILPLLADPATRDQALVALPGNPVLRLNIDGALRLYFKMDYYRTTPLGISKDEAYSYLHAGGQTFRIPLASAPPFPKGLKDPSMEERDSLGRWMRVEPRLRDYVLDTWSYTDDVLSKNDWPSGAKRIVPVSVGVNEEGAVVEELGGHYTRFFGDTVRQNTPAKPDEVFKIIGERVQMAFLPGILNPITRRKALAAEERALSRYWKNHHTVIETAQLLRSLYCPSQRTQGSIRPGFLIWAVAFLSTTLALFSHHRPSPAKALSVAS